MIIIDENYPGIKSDDYPQNWFYYEGDMVLKEDTKVLINLIVKGNQTVEGNQIVEGNQTVKGYQIVEGEQKVLNHLTNFSLSIKLEKWRISFYSDIIKIGCLVHKASHWAKFKDDDIAKMDENALEWWHKWKSFVMNTHSELVKVYGEVNDESIKRTKS